LIFSTRRREGKDLERFTRQMLFFSNEKKQKNSDKRKVRIFIGEGTKNRSIYKNTTILQRQKCTTNLRRRRRRRRRKFVQNTTMKMTI